MTHPLSVIDGNTSKNNQTARDLYRQLVEAYGLPEKITRDGTVADVSAARRLARDPEQIEERFGDESFFLRAAIASVEQAAAEENRGGTEDAFDDLMGRAAEAAETRAGTIDSSVVQDSTPIEVDTVIVDIMDPEAPLLDLVDFEAQPGFTAQFNIISDRGPVQPGAVDESTAVDLSAEDNTDWVLDDDQLDMTILTARMNMSDFTQRAWESLNWGTNDIEETTVGQVMIALARWRAGEMVYGDPDVGLSDGSIQDSNASPGLAYWAQNADDEALTDVDHVVDKSGLDTTEDRARLSDLKQEITELVTNTGATYNRLQAICGPTFFDTIESEVDEVVRLDAYDEGIDFGGRTLNVKGVPLNEVRAVGRDEHGGYDYNDTEDTPAGTWDIDEGDVFIYDTMAFKRRQLAPLSTVPLARRGLADEAVAFEYKANVDKSHGAHVKFLQAYPTA